MQRTVSGRGNYFLSTNWAARGPFGIAALGGGILLALLKTGGASQLIVTSVAVCVILLYAALVYGIRSLRLREDQLGDNCYYLGFLFTLGSLAFALHAFAVDTDINLIVANFGLALGSTITGILLRVMFNQARKDVVETEVDARMMLAEAVVRMRVQIDDAVLALDGFCRSTRQIASEHINSAATSASQALQLNIEQVGTASSEVMQKMNDAYKDFKDHADLLNENSAATVKAVKSLLVKIENIDVTEDLISRKLDPLFQSVDGLANRVAERLEADTKLLSNYSRRAGAIEEKIEKFTTGMSQAERMTGDMSAALQEILREIRESGALLREFSLQQNAISNAVQASAAETIKLVNQAQDELRSRSRDLSGQISGSLKDQAHILASELEKHRILVENLVRDTSPGVQSEAA